MMSATGIYNKTVIALYLDFIHSYSANASSKIKTKQTLVNKIQYSAIMVIIYLFIWSCTDILWPNVLVMHITLYREVVINYHNLDIKYVSISTLKLSI